MTIKLCVMCSSEYTAKRSDSKFCSKACKQKAYLKRESKSSEGETADQINYNQVHYLDEYESVLDRSYGGKPDHLPFVFYCFLRRKLDPNASVEEVIKYFDLMWAWEDIEKYLVSKAYQDFTDQFLRSPGGIMFTKKDRNNEVTVNE